MTGRPASRPHPPTQCQLLAASGLCPQQLLPAALRSVPPSYLFPWSASLGELAEGVCGQLFRGRAWDASSNVLAFVRGKQDGVMTTPCVAPLCTRVWKELLLE